MKTVYFLRHGETVLNKALVHQYPETMLSLRGEEQAQKAAEAFSNIELDCIVSSDMQRAQRTAEIIAERKGLKVETSPLFAELRRPHCIWGKTRYSLASLRTMSQVYMNAGREEWHHSDEENLEEFHTRARRALEVLADRPEERILVVTHRGFIATLRERMERDGLDTVKQFRRALWRSLSIGNCCYIAATWSPGGENGTTLDGTWTMLDGVTCPAGGRYSFGLG